METVLIIGASGHMGVAATSAALRTGRKVLAVVRSQESAEKLFKHVGTREDITVVEADVLSENGVKGVVDQVRAGKLPEFQHVYSAVGGYFTPKPTSILDTSGEELQKAMVINTYSNFYVYRATVPYLLEKKKPSSWTLCVGADGNVASRAGPGLSQGAMYTFSISAARELADTNIRFNEVYLAMRVLFDEVAEQTGVAKVSDFSKNYELLLQRPDVKGARVFVRSAEEMKELVFETKELPEVLG